MYIFHNIFTFPTHNLFYLTRPVTFIDLLFIFLFTSLCSIAMYSSRWSLFCACWIFCVSFTVWVAVFWLMCLNLGCCNLQAGQTCPHIGSWAWSTLSWCTRKFEHSNPSATSWRRSKWFLFHIACSCFCCKIWHISSHLVNNLSVTIFACWWQRTHGLKWIMYGLFRHWAFHRGLMMVYLIQYDCISAKWLEIPFQHSSAIKINLPFQIACIIILLASLLDFITHVYFILRILWLQFKCHLEIRGMHIFLFVFFTH